MRTVGLGYGLIATILLPVALLFFGVLHFSQTMGAIFLLSGLWTLAFGVMMEKKDERLYYSGFGVVVALLSSFLFIAVRYTIGLVIVALVVLALVSATSARSRKY